MDNDLFFRTYFFWIHRMNYLFG